MKRLHCTLSSPAENLALDEQLLQDVNRGEYSDGILRLWESTCHFIVLGLSKKVSEDVAVDACRADDIPIFRRCSGGGTVLQGPGCFNYAFILPIHSDEALLNLQKTTAHVLSKVQATLRALIPNSEQRGISDLAIDGIKFSGNAQRRLKHAILFNGTILYQFDLDLVSRYLKEPLVQPDYRNQRSHQQFISNLPISQKDLMSAFEQAYPTPLALTPVISPDVMAKYLDNTWHFKR